VLAAAHQPITWGCCEQSLTGVGIRPVNTFASYREDIYVPPQRKRFSLFATIRNDGSKSIRIEKLMLGQTYGLLRLAGRVRYAQVHREVGRSVATLACPARCTSWTRRRTLLGHFASDLAVRHDKRLEH
jgi:hypothetical protein